jgi:hypothetical protein
MLMFYTHNPSMKFQLYICKAIICGPVLWQFTSLKHFGPGPEKALINFSFLGLNFTDRGLVILQPWLTESLLY